MSDDLPPLKIKGQRYDLLHQRMLEAHKIMAEMIAAKIFNEGTGSNDDLSKLWQPTATKTQDQG